MDEKKWAVKNKLYFVFAIIIFLLIPGLIISCSDSGVPAWVETAEITEIAEITSYITETKTEKETEPVTEPEPETNPATEIITEIITTTQEPVTEIITTETKTEPATQEPTTAAPVKFLVIPPPPTEPETTADSETGIYSDSKTETEKETENESDGAAEPAPKPVVNGNGGVIAISFDDGPSAHTERLLNILAENNAKATFFIVGYKVDSNKNTVRKMVEQGHEVAGHTWNHPDLRKINDERIKQELQATNTAIYNVTGIYPTFYRAPYGAFNDRVKSVSKEINLALIQWNTDPNDWRVRNADIVYNNIIKMVRDGCIICMHDTHSTTVDAMARVIPVLIEAGYELVTISELLGETEPGIVYYSR